jgi:hypothetical protein
MDAKGLQVHLDRLDDAQVMIQTGHKDGNYLVFTGETQMLRRRWASRM